jgi:hypothetical protein
MKRLYAERKEMRGQVGVVIPAWFSADLPTTEAVALLGTTLAGSAECLDPVDVVVVVDGSPTASAAANVLHARFREEWGEPFTLLDLPENQGKGGALATGIRHLLERNGEPPEWIAVRDADADHFLDDLPHLYRLGEQIAAENSRRPVAVVGSRASVHAPLGWLRGEFELLVNEVLVEGLAYALTRYARAWDTRYLVERAPDLQSGYKLYSRAAAEVAVEGLHREAGNYPDLRLLRVGMEIVPFVEIALADGVFGEVGRKAFYDQPVTSYGTVDVARFYGSKLGWALRRCGVPPLPALILLDGALARRPLNTDPNGRETALRMRDLVLELLDGDPKRAPVEPRMRRFL